MSDFNETLTSMSTPIRAQEPDTDSDHTLTLDQNQNCSSPAKLKLNMYPSKSLFYNIKNHLANPDIDSNSDDDAEESDQSLLETMMPQRTFRKLGIKTV